MKIYIDNYYKCHTANDGTMREFDVKFFYNKCSAFIEGYRYIPDGETWINPQGKKCSGISPWKPYSELEKAQLTYEKEQAETALNILVGE